MTIGHPSFPGLIQAVEGMELARRAQAVRTFCAIVELGSHSGLSTAYLVRGARAGMGAHVTAIDPWGPPRPGSEDDPLGLGPDPYPTFAANMASDHAWGAFTPIRGRSLDLARFWVQPIGLLFIDAVHEYRHIEQDYRLWSPHVAAGGVLALHDYTDDPEHPFADTKAVVDEVIMPSGLWAEPYVVGHLWLAQRT